MANTGRTQSSAVRTEVAASERAIQAARGIVKKTRLWTWTW
jgi:hypothetical protein